MEGPLRACSRGRAGPSRLRHQTPFSRFDNFGELDASDRCRRAEFIMISNVQRKRVVQLVDRELEQLHPLWM